MTREDWIRYPRWLAGRLFGDYKLNRIYQVNLTGFQLRDSRNLDVRRITNLEDLYRSDDQKMRKSASFGGDQYYGFGLWDNSVLASVCWIYTYEQFKEHLIWKPEKDEAMLVDLVTAEEYWGKGYAPALIERACLAMREAGFKRLYAWIWHSNYPSIRAFEKAGWTYIAFAVELYPLGIIKKPIHFHRLRRNVRLES